jgi:hypothetical protein
VSGCGCGTSPAVRIADRLLVAVFICSALLCFALAQVWAIPTGNSFAEKLGSPVKAQALRGSAPALTPAALEYTAAVQAVASPTVSHEEKVYVAMEGTVASFELVNKLRGPNGQYINYIRDKSDCNIDLRVTCGPVPCPQHTGILRAASLRPVGPCAQCSAR